MPRLNAAKRLELAFFWREHRKPPVTAALWAGLDTASVPDRWSDRRLLRGYVLG